MGTDTDIKNTGKQNNKYMEFLKEKPSPDFLSRDIVQELTSGNLSQDTVKRLQEETQAYYIHEPQHYGGVLVHPYGQGPERPYFKPEGNDWVPEVRAIARIGVQYHYWNMLYESFVKGTIELPQWFSMYILVLFPDKNNNFSIYKDDHPAEYNLLYFANKAGDKVPRFNSYICRVNYGGDADFYGPWENHIFPMYVKIGIKDGSYERVRQESLGLTGEQVQATWDSWKYLSKNFGDRYHTSFLQSYQNLSDRFVEVFDKDIRKGELFTGGFAVVRSLIHGGIDSDQDLDFALDVVNTAFCQLCESDKSYIIAAKNHANNLKVMYETAKKYRQDTYHY